MDGDIANMRGVSDMIQKAILKASDGLESIPEDIIVTFSSNIMPHDILTMNYARADKTSTITLEEIDSMIKRVEKRSYDRIKENLLSTIGTKNIDLKLISSSLTSIYIDGKRISNPIGFTGKDIRFTILNIYAPMVDFENLHMVINSLDRKTISLVPKTVLYPKILESSPYIFDTNLYLDIGYARTNMVFEVQNEIVGYSVLPIGISTIEAEMMRIDPDKTFLDIENSIVDMLSMTPEALAKSAKYKTYSGIISDFFTLLSGQINIQAKQTSKELVIKNLFLMSNPAAAKGVKEHITKHLVNTHHAKVRIQVPEIQIGDTTLEIEYASVAWLSIVANELLLVKKDPIVRILRYVIYQYD